MPLPEYRKLFLKRPNDIKKEGVLSNEDKEELDHFLEYLKTGIGEKTKGNVVMGDGKEDNKDKISNEELSYFLEYMSKFDKDEIPKDTQKLLEGIITQSLVELQPAFMYYLARLATASYLRGRYDSSVQNESTSASSFDEFIEGMNFDLGLNGKKNEQ